MGQFFVRARALWLPASWSKAHARTSCRIVPGLELERMLACVPVPWHAARDPKGCGRLAVVLGVSVLADVGAHRPARWIQTHMHTYWSIPSDRHNVSARGGVHTASKMTIMPLLAIFRPRKKSWEPRSSHGQNRPKSVTSFPPNFGPGDQSRNPTGWQDHNCHAL